MKKVTHDKNSLAGTSFLFKSEANNVSDQENIILSQSNANLPRTPVKTSVSLPAEPANNTFNGLLKRRNVSATLVPQSGGYQTRLELVSKNNLQPRRHMYNKPPERAIAINERIERMAQKWTETGIPCSFDDLAHPGRAHPVIS